MSRGMLRALLGCAILVVIVAVAVISVQLRRAAEDATGVPSPPAVSAPPSLEASANPAHARPDPTSRPDEEVSSDMSASEDSEFASALRWSTVDLDAVREALPDNLYWEMSMPTDDAEVLRRREEERERWNREYGKVLSGIVSEEEIEAYFALRRRISEDAIEFSEYLLEHYGEVLPERDRGLLELASRLHAARLQEMPRLAAEARERMLKQDRLREAWLADQAAFSETAPVRHD